VVNYFLLCYLIKIYSIFDSNNKKLQRLIVQRWQLFKTFNAPEEPIMNYVQTQKTYGMTNTYRKFSFGNIYKDFFCFVERFEEEIDNSSRIPIDYLIAMSRISIDFQTAALKIMMTRYFRGHTRFKMAVRFVISQV